MLSVGLCGIPLHDRIVACYLRQDRALCCVSMQSRPVHYA